MKNKIVYTLLFLSVSAFSCKKSSPFIAGSQYTSKMGGMRTWTVSDSYTSCSHPSAGFDTTYIDNLAITIRNDTSISFAGNTLLLTSLDTTNKDVIFGSINGGSSGVGVVVLYFYNSDSVFCVDDIHFAVCSDQYTTYSSIK